MCRAHKCLQAIVNHDFISSKTLPYVLSRHGMIADIECEIYCFKLGFSVSVEVISKR